MKGTREKLFAKQDKIIEQTVGQRQCSSFRILATERKVVLVIFVYFNQYY